jgi:mannose-6-phosphate isomerase-like protein (cupin superfamily)
MELKPREGLKSHITPVDVFFYILDGSDIVEIGGESEKVEKDTLIESSAGIPHRPANDVEGRLKFLVVKILRRRESAKVLWKGSHGSADKRGEKREEVC